MRKYAVYIGIISLTFLIGIAGAFLLFNNPKDQISDLELQDRILSVCEVVKNPEKYNDRTIRIEGVTYSNMHGRYFANSDCSEGESNYSEKDFVALDYTLGISEELKKRMREEGIPEGKFFRSVIKLRASGRFEKAAKCSPCSDSMHDRTQLHFEIIEIEKAEFPEG